MRFYRSRLLLRGLSTISAVRCIVALAIWRWWAIGTTINVKYQKSGRALTATIRAPHFESDFQSVLELAAGDCYHLEELNWRPECVYDCGSNTGLFTLYAAAKWPNCAVTAFEPVSHNIHAIEGHLQMNRLRPRVKLEPCAIGPSRRIASFYIRSANQGSFEPVTGDEESISIDVLPFFETYSADIGRDTLVKLDVEGAEHGIMDDLFNRQGLSRLVIVMEVHGDRAVQAQLLSRARRNGWVGGFWEIADHTAHLYLATPDVGIVTALDLKD